MCTDYILCILIQSVIMQYVHDAVIVYQANSLHSTQVRVLPW